MVQPRFNFFITQDDGKIFGSAVDPENNEPVAYIIAPNGSVSTRKEGIWYDLPDGEAVHVRRLAGRAYRFCTNYLIHTRTF